MMDEKKEQPEKVRRAFWDPYLWGWIPNYFLIILEQGEDTEDIFSKKEDGSVLDGKGEAVFPESFADETGKIRLAHPKELPARFVSTALAAFRAIVGNSKKNDKWNEFHISSKIKKIIQGRFILCVADIMWMMKRPGRLKSWSGRWMKGNGRNLCRR